MMLGCERADGSKAESLHVIISLCLLGNNFRNLFLLQCSAKNAPSSRALSVFLPSAFKTNNLGAYPSAHIPKCRPMLRQTEKTRVLHACWAQARRVRSLAFGRGAHEVANIGWLGIAELLIFHPVDTVAKRLMSNKSKVNFLFTIQ